MRKLFMTPVTVAIVLGWLSPCVTAEDRGAEQMPPANVVVSTVKAGTISPQEEFIGTVYYPEVSEVSAEVSGTVERIAFEEGQRAEKGELLVKLDSVLLEKDLQAKRASYEQSLSDLEKARKDFERTENLFKKRIVAQKEYDDQDFQVKSLEKKVAALKAAFEYLEIEIQKTLIRAPFSGVIITRHVARGEWLSPGKTVATIARDDVMDIIVEVPQQVATYVRRGMSVTVMVAGERKTGTVVALIPRGDIATRSFPVKVRVNNPNSLPLFEGMEARVQLPVGRKINVLMVPRDAVLNLPGGMVVVVVEYARAEIVRVEAMGYQGMRVGIRSQKISQGMKVVVKGNERLRDGQPVSIIKEID
jgi:RND family efflux transporter MFP subunit